MTTKRKIQMITDFLMVLLLPLLMAYNLISEVAHECFGVAMILLFLCHHLLNRHWYKSLAKGKYSKTRILSVAVNFLLLIIMAALAVSGIAASKHLFAFLPIKGGQTAARTVHLISAYWGFVLMSFHTGLHGGMLLKMAKKAFHIPSLPKYGNVIVKMIVFSISAYGIYAFIHRQLGEYMLLKTQYVFFDFSEPLLYFMADYIAIMFMGAFSGYYGLMVLMRREQKSARIFQGKQR